MKKIYIIGEDKRQEALKKIYSKNLVDDLKDANIVVLPTPVSKDGIIISESDINIINLLPKLKDKIILGGKFPDQMILQLRELGVVYYDFMDYEELAIKNAIPTAEGTIKKAIELMDKTLFNSNILILGFGKCGKILADRLAGFKANVFCAARKEKDIAQIETMGYNSLNINNIENVLSQMDLVINTVPSILLNKARIDCLKSETVIIDIASYPGGTDFEYCKQKNITAVLDLGIPAKVAPKSASEYIRDIIERLI